MEKVDYISHIKQDDNQNWIIQPNSEHQENVAKLAESFADQFGLSHLGYLLGILHDEGKQRQSFQNYISRESGYDIEAEVESEHNHAFVGSILAHNLFNNSTIGDNLIANPIASHHSGLHDYDEMHKIVNRELPNDYNNAPTYDTSQIKLQIKQISSKFDSNDFNHLVRVLFSCLVDADYLDTERFMNKEAANSRGCAQTLSALSNKLDLYLENLSKMAKNTPLNELRRKIQHRCLETSKWQQGFYSLTVPTGGGKTLSSLLWAMKHAITNGQNRIIIAIPYTSIIVQTASILKGIFGEENVLEHHSSINVDSITDEKFRNKAKLASENWDYPIIVTTNVQLFESMYANKPSTCRKLHNIVNSVIILDEVQTLPTDFLMPIVNALKTYQKTFNTSILFTTASQPVLSGTIVGCNNLVRFPAIDKITEIIPEDYALHEKLRRVDFSISEKALSYDELANEIAKHKRILCVVNTRKDAKEIFDRLPNEGLTFHLSRMMCPAHIKKTITEIKEALRSNENSTIRVIATQLIEAGVDIDFPVVFRQESGLDSVLQAAGRCNREGRLRQGKVTVFSIEGRNPFGHVNISNNARKSLTKDCDYLSPSTMTQYFNQLYSRCNSFDRKGIHTLLDKPLEMCFKTAAREFRLIDDNGVTIYVNYGNCAKYMEQIHHDGISYPIIKRISEYSVSIHEKDYIKLREMGAITDICENLYYVDSAKQYDEKTGVVVDNVWLEEILTI